MATGQVNGVFRGLRKAALGQDGGGMTDGQLLTCFITGRDEAAFAALVRRHGPMVLAVCQRVLRHGHDAEDAFQATFLVLARKAASITRRELVGNWLYGVAYRAALEVKAARRRRGENVNPMPEPTTVDDSALWNDLRPILDQELNALPEKYRAAVVLCDLEGRTRREAAMQLGIPEGTLSGRLTTARRTLARRLARRGLALSIAALATALSQGTASAGLSATLAVTTTRAATAVAAGSAAGSFVSAHAAAAMEGVLKIMLLCKLKSVTALLLACLIIGGLTVAGAIRAVAGEQEDTRPAPAPAKDQPPAPPAAKAQPVGPGFVAVESDRVEAVAFAADNNMLVVGGADKKVHLWDLRTGKVLRTLEGPQGIVRKVQISKDGKTAVAGADDGVIFLWNVNTGKLEAELKADLPSKPKGKGPFDGVIYVNGLLFLPGGMMAAIYNYEHKDQGNWCSRIVLWDVQKKKAEVLHEERGHSYGLALSPDGKSLAVALWGDTSGFKVWDLATRKVVWEETAGDDFMSTVAFTPDGKTLVVGGGHSVQVQGGFRAEGRLWAFDVKTHKQLWHVKEPDNWTYSRVAITADGKGVLTGSSGPTRAYKKKGLSGQKVLSELRLWDTATGKLVWKTEGELGNFQALDVSADGKTIAGSDDAQLMLFDPDTGALRTVLSKVRR